MLESGKFFDSLQGRLTGILLGTLTFGAVVPTILNYLGSILYCQQARHPALDFQLVALLYFLPPALCVALAWPFILKADDAAHLLPHRQQHWARWLPAAGLLGLATGAGWLFADLSWLPPRWVAGVCLGLLLVFPPLAGLVALLVNVRLHHLPVRPPGAASRWPAYLRPARRLTAWLRHAPPAAEARLLAVRRPPEPLTLRQFSVVAGMLGAEGVFQSIKYGRYARAANHLAQCEGNYLQLVQQLQSKRELKARIDSTSVSTDTQLKQAIQASETRLVAQATWLHRSDSARFSRIEATLHPYPFPKRAVLAGAYQANAYSLGLLHYHAACGWVAAAAVRVDATDRLWGVEAAFGYRTQLFGLLAGPTCQFATGLLGWKLQALLLKKGPTLGATYDSRLGPGVLVAVGF